MKDFPFIIERKVYRSNSRYDNKINSVKSKIELIK